MYRKLNPVLQKVAESELNEESGRIQSDLEHIRQWIKLQPHLNFEIDNQLLLSFLRCCKFSLERTKEKIDNYYTMRTLVPEVYANRDPFLPEIQLVLSAGVVLPLPQPLDEDGPRIILFILGDNLNPDTITFSNIAKVTYMVLDILIREDDRCVVSGINTWSICKKFSNKYVSQMPPPQIKKFLSIAQNGIPIRFKEFFVCECPLAFQYAYDFAKLIFSKKLSERMSLHARYNSEEFYEKIPQRLFPKELGGANGSIEEITVEWKRKIESYRDWLMQDEKIKTNEDLRACNAKSRYDLFGIEGSFRNLNVD